jgi:hypothetical protein
MQNVIEIKVDVRESTDSCTLAGREPFTHIIAQGKNCEEAKEKFLKMVKYYDEFMRQDRICLIKRAIWYSGPGGTMVHNLRNKGSYWCQSFGLGFKAIWSDGLTKETKKKVGWIRVPFTNFYFAFTNIYKNGGRKRKKNRSW